jgi:hypothetical protein
MKRELATITAYIQANELLKGSFFYTIDEAFRIAKLFVKMYDKNCTWEEDSYEEKIEEFTEKFKKRKYKKV